MDTFRASWKKSLICLVGIAVLGTCGILPSPTHAQSQPLEVIDNPHLIAVQATADDVSYTAAYDKQTDQMHIIRDDGTESIAFEVMIQAFHDEQNAKFAIIDEHHEIYSLGIGTFASTKRNKRIAPLFMTLFGATGMTISRIMLQRLLQQVIHSGVAIIMGGQLVVSQK